MLSYTSPRATMQQVLMKFAYTATNVHVQKVLHCLKVCRTASSGYHVYQCTNDACGEIKYRYHSCRDRHCRQWPQFRIHHQVGAHGDVRRLDEEPEGKGRLDFEPLDPVQPPSGEQDRIGLGHRGTGRQVQDMDASIHGLAFDDVQDAEREARQPWLAVHEGEHNQRRPVGEDMVRNPTANDEVTQALLGEDAGHDDEAEHHRQQQVEQVVPRVERSDPNRQGQQQESHAFRRQAQGPVAVEPAEELADALEPHET